MSRFASSPSSVRAQTQVVVRSRTSAPRLRAELKPLLSSWLLPRPELALTGLWAPDRLDRLHEPLTRYHD